MSGQENDFLSEEAKQKIQNAKEEVKAGFEEVKVQTQQAAAEAKAIAENDLKQVKSAEDVFKLPWYYPAGVALVLTLLAIFHDFSWAIVGIGVVLTATIAIFQAQSKPSPIKLAWYWIALPTIALAALLLMPSLTGWIIGALLLWAVIAGLLKYKPWGGNNTEPPATT